MLTEWKTPFVSPKGDENLCPRPIGIGTLLMCAAFTSWSAASLAQQAPRFESPVASEAPDINRRCCPQSRMAKANESQLDISGQVIDSKLWSVVKSNGGLGRLVMSECSIAPGFEVDFSELQNLKYVSIIDTPLSREEVHTLTGLGGLREASFELQQGIDQWLSAISQLRQLRTLRIDGDISDRGVRRLSDMDMLTSLSLRSNRLTSSGVAALAGMDSLRQLDLIGTQVDDTGLQKLASLTKLERLHVIEGGGDRGRGGRALVSDSGVSFLASLRSLEDLKLDSSRITSESAATIARLQNLKYLMLAGTKMGDDGIQWLSELTKLELLDLSGTAVTDVGVDLRMPLLRYLNLAKTNLTDKGMLHIAHLPNLRVLVLTGTRVTSESIDALASMASLQQIYVYNTHIDVGSAEAIGLLNALEARRAKELEQLRP